MKTEYTTFDEFFQDLEAGQLYCLNVTEHDVEWHEDTEEKKEALVHGPKKRKRRIRPTLIGPIKKKRNTKTDCGFLGVIDLTKE